MNALTITAKALRVHLTAFPKEDLKLVLSKENERQSDETNILYTQVI